MEEKKEFYSQEAIALSTFLGGPLAAGVLIRANYKALEKETQGSVALVAGIAATVILIAAFFLIPGETIDQIPYLIIPLIYTGITALIVDQTQGKDLKQHKEVDGKFQSLWKAAGIGSVSLALIGGSMATVAYLTGYQPDPNSYYDPTFYNIGMAEFGKKEAASLLVFNAIERKESDQIIRELNNGIVIWKQNKAVIESIDRTEKLPKDLTARDILLIRYCNLRIEQFTVLQRSYIEATDKYRPRIDIVERKIEKIINELKR